jgi:hypothetical protein
VCVWTVDDEEFEDNRDDSDTLSGNGSGIGGVTGGAGAARRVAPSVLGASRRSSLSAPQRVLQRPVREEEGMGTGTGTGDGARRR